MKSQFRSGANARGFQRAPTPPLSHCDFADISTASEFSNATLISASTAQTHKSAFPDRFFRRKRPFMGEGNANFTPKCKPNPNFPRKPPRYFEFNSTFKSKRLDFPASDSFSRSPSGRPSFSRETAKEIPPLISPPIPPLVSARLSSPEEAPGPNRTNRPGRGPTKKQRKNEGKQKMGRRRGGVEMAVFDACPGSRLSEEQGTQIEAALVRELDSVRGAEAQPKFVESFFDQGVFWMTCANASTKQWLLRSIRKLNKSFHHLNLKVVEARIPKRPMVYVDLVDLDRAEEVLRRLNGQNPSLKTSKWIVLNRKVFEAGQRVTFSIDLDSFEFLKSKKFRASWKLKTITFKVPGKRGKDAAVKSMPSLPPKPHPYQHF